MSTKLKRCFSTILGFMLLTSTSILLIDVNAQSEYYQDDEYKEYSNNHDNERYSSYPTELNKYECRKGPFEGFFVSSVEFCKPNHSTTDNGNPNPTTDNGNPNPIVSPSINITKELFVCNDAISDPTNFFCFGNSLLINGPTSGNYTQCTDQTCFVNESDFGVQIFKDVAMIPSLTQQNTNISYNDNNYVVAEDRIDKLIDKESECQVAGFVHDKAIVKSIPQGVVEYLVCVDYEGDCTGPISAGEEKVCTIKNYLVGGLVTPPVENLNNATSPLNTQLQIQSNINNIQENDNQNAILSSVNGLPF